MSETCAAAPNASACITRPENCTGCGLCANVCPKGAIEMVWNEDGFLSPKVDVASCINCGLCVRRCIALEERPVYEDDITKVESYGAWNRDAENHLQSSSGGVFMALGRHILSQGGCVFGVVWQDKLTPVYAKAETEAELIPMRGSKYAQALPLSVYRGVKAELKSGRKVLFSGTPCAVHALRRFIGKEDVNLYTMDIVCHGTPSHLILEKFISETETRTGRTVEHVSFRDKPEGWRNFHVTRHYTDGSSESCAQKKDDYMCLFLCDLALNRACYNCAYAHLPRRGDLSLGDYWGVWRHHRDWPVKKGISSLLVNTEKGKRLLQGAEAELVLKEEPFEQIYKGQDVVYIKPPKQIPEERAVMLETLKQSSLGDIRWKYMDSETFGPWLLHKKHPLCRFRRFLKKLFGIKQSA